MLSWNNGWRLHLQDIRGYCRPLINTPPSFKGLDIRIPIITPFKGLNIGIPSITPFNKGLNIRIPIITPFKGLKDPYYEPC